MKVKFLLDENLTPRLKTAVLRLNPAIDILRIGDPGTLSFGSLDPEVLVFLERSQRLLITDNRVSMPGHLETHWSASRHLYGLLWVRPKTPTRLLSQELRLIWEATQAEEWIDVLDWIPF